MSTGQVIMRSSRKMFMGVGEKPTAYTRLRGFTALTKNMNPTEYTRKYVDETFETTDVTGISPSFDFTFDAMTPDAVSDEFASIIDDEKIGNEAVREFVSVDFHKPSGDGFEAVKRSFSIIPSSNGDGTDALTYSGTLRAKGSSVKGIATIATPEGGTPETVDTITFTEATEATE